jgi:hypothetical protein
MQQIWGRREIHTGFWWGNPKERDHLEQLGIGGKVILKWEGVDWIHVAQDRDKWWVLVSMVMNLQVP